MQGMTGDSTVVALFDGEGRLVWTSGERQERELGLAGEEYVQADQRGLARRAMNEVLMHRKSQQLQLVNDLGLHYRVSLWPLESPDVAVCALCMQIPESLSRLSAREQDCMKLLAHGASTDVIAEQLNIAVSTVHTHLKRIREKLDLPNLESLISFAARHCEPPECPVDLLPDTAGL